MFITVIILHVLVSLALIAIILLQAGRGGLSESFGGAPTQSLFGTQTATFLTRTTTVCAVLFFCTCLTLAVLSGQRSRSLMEQVPLSQRGVPPGLVEELLRTAPKPAPSAPAPAAGILPTATPAAILPAIVPTTPAPAAAPQTSPAPAATPAPSAAQDHPPTR